MFNFTFLNLLVWLYNYRKPGNINNNRLKSFSFTNLGWIEINTYKHFEI